MTATGAARRVILVTGATGNQGGAVARRLLSGGDFTVRALTRDAEQRAARELVAAGARVVEGDLDEPETLRAPLEGAHGVFAVQNFWETGYDREVRQGVALAEEALRAGVEHFVYSSVGGADRDTGIPHFDSKWEIEEHLRDTGLQYTILRPVFFMQNWEQPSLRNGVLDGQIVQPLSPDTPLQQIAVEDIGAFGAMAFGNPARWKGREVEIAGDELTMPEVADLFSRVTGLEVEYLRVPFDDFEEAAGEEYAVMYRWFEEEGYEADIRALREVHPGLRPFEEYLRDHGWEKPESKRG